MKSENQLIVLTCALGALGYSIGNMDDLFKDLGLTLEEAQKFESISGEFAKNIDNVEDSELFDAFKETIQQIIKD